jgi:nucleotide-binding universal stress UspA family protein
MFANILHANDGSDHAQQALVLAVRIADQNDAKLHMVCVEEIPAMPEYIEDIRETTAIAGRRFHKVIQNGRMLAQRSDVSIETHLRVGHPVRAIVELAEELKADLLVIGATGHSALYERMIGSRADRIVQLARCPVLVVK